MVGRFTSRFSDKPNLAALMRIVGKQVQELEDIAFKILAASDVDNAAGYMLDVHGRRVDEPRNNRLDVEYKAAIKARRAALASDGSVDNMIVQLNARLDQAYPKTNYIYPNTVPISNLIAYRALVEQVKPAAVQIAIVENSDSAPVFRLDSPDPNGLNSGKLSRRV